MAEPQDKPEEAIPRNIVSSYYILESLRVGVAVLNTKMDHLTEGQAKQDKTYDEHEERIRALERAFSTMGARGTMATFLFQAIWPVAGIIIAAMSYYNAQ